ncbi:IS630 family transposase [Rhizophagus clarus]|uniref:IS630 family transposase n=1 Tax=Rhizophagus clarus TaxID=94130 RepID=A0A8H3LTL8_9GLOM|nr:IS630 family transposase [Rhizophagus clarus]
MNESVKDERSLLRLYGYSSKNTHIQKKVVFIQSKWYTILFVLTLEGFVAVDIFEGSCDKKKFVNFVLDKIMLIMNPYPRDNNIIIMDNARIHHNDELIALFKELRYHVIFLPPYSSDYNPIKNHFQLYIFKKHIPILSSI